jgi:hypothetical protein
MNEKPGLLLSAKRLDIGSFFNRALDAVQSPFLKLLVVFAFVALTVILLVQPEKCEDSALRFVAVTILLVIFAVLAAVMQYAELQFKRAVYLQRTETELKKALRETVRDARPKAKPKKR